MKKILLIFTFVGIVLTSCGKHSTTPVNDGSNDLTTLAVVVDPPDETNDCELSNTSWEDFAQEVKSLFSENEIAAIETALGEPISCSLLHCFEDNYRNHGGFVSCISHWTNTLKKAKVISGKEKGIIVNIAARSDVGK